MLAFILWNLANWALPSPFVLWSMIWSWVGYRLYQIMTKPVPENDRQGGA